MWDIQTRKKKDKSKKKRKEEIRNEKKEELLNNESANDALPLDQEPEFKFTFGQSSTESSEDEFNNINQLLEDLFSIKRAKRNFLSIQKKMKKIFHKRK